MGTIGIAGANLQLKRYDKVEFFSWQLSRAEQQIVIAGHRKTPTAPRMRLSLAGQQAGAKGVTLRLVGDMLQLGDEGADTT